MTADCREHVTIYTPGSALRQPSRLLADLFRGVWRGRGLAWWLAVRDISAQYRQAALGLLWALILPLANTAVWIFLNGSGIVLAVPNLRRLPIHEVALSEGKPL